MVIKTDLAIIGGGIAGLSAAMYAGRFGLDVTVFDSKVGGTIVLTDTVENYPGFKKLTGQELSDKIKEQAAQFKMKIVNRNVEKVIKKHSCFYIDTKKERYKARAVILATGTKWRKLKVPGEKELDKRGVHYCALCDGPIYKGKVLAIVGGGDSAAKEALTLANMGSKVYLIARGPKIMPEPINYKRIMDNKKIEIIPNTEVVEILGKDKVEKIKLSKKYKGSDELDVGAIFIDVGRIPMTRLAKEIGVKLNKKGEVIADNLMKTNIEGFFVGGDVSDTPFKQAVTAAAEGSTAAFSAYDYVSKTPLCSYGDEPLNPK